MCGISIIFSPIVFLAAGHAAVDVVNVNALVVLVGDGLTTSKTLSLNKNPRRIRRRNIRNAKTHFLFLRLLYHNEYQSNPVGTSIHMESSGLTIFS